MTPSSTAIPCTGDRWTETHTVFVLVRSYNQSMAEWLAAQIGGEILDDAE